MKKPLFQRLFKTSLTLLASLPALTLTMQAETLTLSREQCVEIGLDKSPTIRIADVEVRKSDYSKKETLAQLFPQVDFQLAYQRSIELQTIRMDFGGASQALKMGSDNSWNTGFSASLPLIAPTLWKSISISDTQILQSLESARASRIDLINSISKSYFALQLAIASREVLKENHEVAKFNAEMYRKQFEQGTASEYDVLRSSVQVTNMEPELLQADIAVRQCQLQLLVLTGLEKGTEILPSNTLEEARTLMKPIVDPSPSFDANSTLRSLDLQARLASQSTSLRKLAFLPTLGASFNINWNSLSNGSPFRDQKFYPYCNVGIALSLPILTGGSRWQQLRQAKANETEIALQRENLVSSLNMQVELAIDNCNREAAQINSSLEGVRQAEKARAIMQKSFEIGAATYLELRDSEVADMNARLAYYQAIHNYLTSLADLRSLLGEESY
ncbi:MAG: TolC family protein [Bacteroides sp.]|nr:TolC family protein [Bacteroides sp.]